MAAHIKQNTEPEFARNLRASQTGGRSGALEKALRLGLSSALVLPYAFVGIQNAYADEPSNGSAQISPGSTSSPANAREAAVQLSAAESNMANYEKCYNAAEAKAAEADAAAVEARKALDDSEEQLGESAEALNRAEQNMKASASNEDELRSEVAEAESANAQAQESLGQRETELDEATHRANDAQENTNQARAAFDDALVASNAADHEVESARSSLAEKEDYLAEIEVMTEEERIAKAQADVDESKKELETATKNLQSAKANHADATSNYNAAYEAYEAAQSAFEQALHDTDLAQQNVARYRANLATKATILENSRADLALAQATLQDSEKDLATAQAALDAQEAQLAQAQAAKTAADETLTRAAEAEQQARAFADIADTQLAHGLYGFLEHIGCTAGLNAIDNSKYAELTEVGAAKDATSMQSLLESAKYMRECNALRAKHGLSPLKISPVLLAMAAADANYSDTVIGHAQQFYVGENVAWNYGSDPFSQWYDDEKKEYEATGDRSAAGHYFNIISSSYTVTGFATCYRGTTNKWITYAQTFQSDPYYEQDAMTVDEFEAAVQSFQATCENAASAYLEAKNALIGAQQQSATANTNVTNATAARNDAEANVMSAQGRCNNATNSISNANDALNSAQEAYDSASGELERAQEELASQEARYSKAQQAVEECTSKLQETQDLLEHTADAYERAEESVQSAAAGLEDKNLTLSHVSEIATIAQSEVDAARKALNDALKTQTAIQTRLDASQAELESAQLAAADANVKMENARLVLAEAIMKRDEAEARLTQARDALNALIARQQALAACEADYEDAVRNVGLAREALREAENRQASAHETSSMLRNELIQARAAVLLAQLDLNKYASLEHNSSRTESTSYASVAPGSAEPSYIAATPIPSSDVSEPTATAIEPRIAAQAPSSNAEQNVDATAYQQNNTNPSDRSAKSVMTSLEPSENEEQQDPMPIIAVSAAAAAIGITTAGAVGFAKTRKDR